MHNFSYHHLVKSRDYYVEKIKLVICTPSSTTAKMLSVLFNLLSVGINGWRDTGVILKQNGAKS